MKLRAIAIAAFIATSTGCAGQAENFDDKDWTREHGIEGGKWREVESLFSAEESDADKGKFVLRGVRHDLTISKSVRADAACTCMDVVLGAPNDTRFRWAGERPLVGRGKLAVAVRTEGTKCPAGTPDNRRPSIRAIDHDGPHVILVIEELPFDRPQALGAIISKPKPGGSLWLRSRRFPKRRKKARIVLPYGRNALVKKACHIYKNEVAGVRPRSGT